ncbi:kynurenine 3-monooxygenase [Legionella beliardensis]|uniref:Kynurenine 3-monooxygenase n=1 Tax=Legionella beliardensis TaxID=91822 RepID=A0A378I0H7_9GAMM|nr:NAD(P)/FAD-dependent oxidoreductase [Legionella beliardensis]STX28659.1 kynurenine 3-monooxygenase [Legionella beliardensis]
MSHVTIIGSGLAGTLLSLYLAKRDYQVELFESRPDMRLGEVDKGRSINLAMSCRGLTGLAGVGLMPEVEQIMVPMRARAIHEMSGEIKYQPFGRHANEYINAIQRSDLNKLLLSQAEALPNVKLYFSTRLLDINLDKKLLILEDAAGQKFNKSYQHLIGADGASSVVRQLLSDKKAINFTRDYLNYGYKELSISGASPEKMAREHLHLWPRASFLLLGNPNCDHSITGSLFLAHEGENSLAKLKNEITVNAFFKKFFKDAYDEMPNLVEEFFHNPTGNMSTIKCAPWYYQDQCLLIGDAAHGLVPFFGQGMNSAFEDCRIFNETLQQYNDNWADALPAFYQTRKINTDAVAQMSMDNFHEIQSDICDEKFNLKKQLEHILMNRYPERYVSKHALVMFTNVSYAHALAVGQLQNEFLNKICANIKTINDLNWPHIDLLMEEYDKKLANLKVH